jgi:hypothetical protein
VEFQAVERLQQIRLKPREPDLHPTRFTLPEKMLEDLETHDVRVPHALKANKHMFDFPRPGLLFHKCQITVEFGGRSKEQFAFEIIDEKAVIRSVRRSTSAHHVMFVEDEITSLQLRRSPHEQHDGNSDADQNRQIKSEGEARYWR